MASSTLIIVSLATQKLVINVFGFILNNVTSFLLINFQATTFPKVKISSQYLTLNPKLGYILGNIIFIPGALPIILSKTIYSPTLKIFILVTINVTSILYK